MELKVLQESDMFAHVCLHSAGLNVSDGWTLLNMFVQSSGGMLETGLLAREERSTVRYKLAQRTLPGGIAYTWSILVRGN
jgi:hypothetical protein